MSEDHTKRRPRLELEGRVFELDNVCITVDPYGFQLGSFTGIEEVETMSEAGFIVKKERVTFERTVIARKPPGRSEYWDRATEHQTTHLAIEGEPQTSVVESWREIAPGSFEHTVTEQLWATKRRG
jgi:hypothetical protein